MLRREWLIILALVAGCSESEPPARMIDRPDIGERLRARARVRDAVHRYALAGAPEEVRECLRELEEIAADPRYPLLAARARFTVAHAWGYVFNDADKAIEQFEMVIRLVPPDPLAKLARSQIEAMKLRADIGSQAPARRRREVNSP